jgi:hypothetical protein
VVVLTLSGERRDVREVWMLAFSHTVFSSNGEPVLTLLEQVKLAALKLGFFCQINFSTVHSFQFLILLEIQ